MANIGDLEDFDAIAVPLNHVMPGSGPHVRRASTGAVDAPASRLVHLMIVPAGARRDLPTLATCTSPDGAPTGRELKLSRRG
jgi:hypothetical protein